MLHTFIFIYKDKYIFISIRESVIRKCIKKSDRLVVCAFILDLALFEDVAFEGYKCNVEVAGTSHTVS